MIWLPCSSLLKFHLGQVTAPPALLCMAWPTGHDLACLCCISIMLEGGAEMCSGMVGFSKEEDMRYH